jgi:cytochrome c biogenesis protein CcmG, thiol:disulfide interchange protein DsbE
VSADRDEPIAGGGAVDTAPGAEGSGAPAQAARRRPRWGGNGLAVIVVSAALALGGVAMAGRGDSLAFDPAGTTAPDFVLPTLDGGQQRFSESFGSPIVLNFWASWCTSCQREAPVLAAGWERWRERGVVFMSVNSQDGRSWAQRFVAQYGITYTVFFDETGQVGRLFGLTGHPETFFLDREGNVVTKWIGPVDDSTLERLVTLIAKDA